MPTVKKASAYDRNYQAAVAKYTAASNANKKAAATSDLNPQARNAVAGKKAEDIAQWQATELFNQQMPETTDPFGGQSIQSMLAALAGGGSGAGASGSGSSSGGGGGGGSAASKAAAQQTLNELLWNGTVSQNDMLTNQLASLSSLRDSQLGNIDAVGSQQRAALEAALAAQNAGFTQRGTQLGDMRSQADARTQQITGDLRQGAAQAQGVSNQAFQGTQGSLQQLMAEYAQSAAAQQAGANRTLGAFGAGVTQPGGGGVQDLLMASQARNTQLQGANNQMYANRGNVYNGLAADASQQNGNMFTGLMAQLQSQQQAAQAAAAQQQAQLAMQLASQTGDVNNGFATQQYQAQSANQQALLDLQLKIAQAQAGL